MALTASDTAAERRTMTGESWADAVSAALDWWHDAGVDCAFLDTPRDWLAAASAGAQTDPHAPQRSVQALPAEADSPSPSPLADRSGWPQTLDAFAPWWLGEPALSPPGQRRLPPVGPAQAPLMVLVAMPAADDGDALLSGRTGKLLDAMLGAAGLDRGAIYLASALPAHVPMPDWDALRTRGMGDVLLHHVALAAPRRLLILGASGISALLGHDPPKLAQSLRAINHDTSGKEESTQGSGIDALATWDLETMLSRPGLKAGLWSRWLDWTHDGTTHG